MQHPDITRTNLTGYSEPIEYPVAVDEFKHDVYQGDEIYIWNDQVYLICELSQDAVQILENNGAKATTA